MKSKTLNTVLVLMVLFNIMIVGLIIYKVAQHILFIEEEVVKIEHDTKEITEILDKYDIIISE